MSSVFLFVCQYNLPVYIIDFKQLEDDRKKKSGREEETLKSRDKLPNGPPGEDVSQPPQQPQRLMPPGPPPGAPPGLPPGK